MSRKVIIVLAALCIGFTGASFAAVESIKVSGDITATAVNRDLGLGGGGSLGVPTEGSWENSGHGNLDSEQFAFSQVRIRFDADLTEGVSAVIRLINERAWGSEDVENHDSGNPAAMNTLRGGDTEVDIDLAYVEMKEFLYQPLTLIIGRQNLRYGNALIIGDPDTNQTASAKVPRDFADQSLRKSFDAVRAILDYSPYTIDLIYASIDENISNISDDRNLWAAYATYDWASYNGVTEGYVLYLNQDRDSIFGTPLTVPPTIQLLENQSKTFTIGSRVQYDPNDNWTVGLEGAYQFGDIRVLDADGIAGSGLANRFQHLSAFAAQLIGQYRFLNDYNAMLQLEYTYLSGDDDVYDDMQTGWQPLFEDQTAGEIINMLFPNSGTQAISLRGSMMPREDITIGGSYTWIALAQKVNYDNVGNVDFQATTYTSLVGPAAGNTYNIEGNQSYLGSEVDAFMLYDYTEDVQIKLTSAVFIPGSFFQHENNTPAYSLKAGISVDF